MRGIITIICPIISCIFSALMASQGMDEVPQELEGRSLSRVRSLTDSEIAFLPVDRPLSRPRSLSNIVTMDDGMGAMLQMLDMPSSRTPATLELSPIIEDVDPSSSPDSLSVIRYDESRRRMGERSAGGMERELDLLRRELALQRLYMQRMAFAMTAIMGETVRLRTEVEELRVSAEPVLEARIRRIRAEEDLFTGTAFRELYAGLQGECVFKDWGVSHGSMATVADRSQLGILIASGALRLIPVPGAAGIGIAFSIVADGIHDRYEAIAREIRQRNLRSPASAEEILTDISLDLWDVYKPILMKLTDRGQKRFAQALSLKVVHALSEFIATDRADIQTLVRRKVLHSSWPRTRVLLKDKTQLSIEALHRASGWRSPDGALFVPLITHDEEVSATLVRPPWWQRLWSWIVKPPRSFDELIEGEAQDIPRGVDTHYKGRGVYFDFKRSEVALVQTPAGTFVHPGDPLRQAFLLWDVSSPLIVMPPAG